MGHCSNAGSSPDSPLLDDHDAAFEGAHFDFVPEEVRAEFPLGKLVIGEVPVLCGRERYCQP